MSFFFFTTISCELLLDLFSGLSICKVGLQKKKTRAHEIVEKKKRPKEKSRAHEILEKKKRPKEKSRTHEIIEKENNLRNNKVVRTI